MTAPRSLVEDLVAHGVDDWVYAASIGTYYPVP
jgi:hypothetical protein